MNRRGVLWAAMSSVGAALVAQRAEAATPDVGKHKVVYHLSDLDRVAFALGNIQNHFDGVGGPDNVTLALVINGPALRAFHRAAADPDMTRRIGHFAKAGLVLHACGNTMKAQDVSLTQLLPGFVEADRGGVVRIAELQSQGYFYIKP